MLFSGHVRFRSC
jgi:hypothetical protein